MFLDMKPVEVAEDGTQNSPQAAETVPSHSHMLEVLESTRVALGSKLSAEALHGLFGKAVQVCTSFHSRCALLGH